MDNLWERVRSWATLWASVSLAFMDHFIFLYTVTLKFCSVLEYSCDSLLYVAFFFWVKRIKDDTNSSTNLI